MDAIRLQYSQMDIVLFFSYLAAGIPCMFLWWKVFSRFGVLDKPGKDVPPRNPVPTLQWVTIIWTFIVLLFITKHLLDLSYYGKEFLWLFIWGLIIALVSIIDEMGYLIDKKYSLSPSIRMFIQIVVAVAARRFSWIWIQMIAIPGFTWLELSWLTSLLATVGRFILFINAINWFDGITWLATWMSSIWFLTIFLLLVIVVFPWFEFMTFERSELLLRVKIISLILFVVSLLGTIMEYKPWGLMRDVGTMFLGFSLWYLALLWWAKIWTILVVLALPLFDAIRVILDRLKRGNTPLKGDYSHLHYRLLSLGRNRGEVRVFIWTWSLFFMMIVLMLGTNSIAKLVLLISMAVIFFGANAYLFRMKDYPSNFVPPVAWKTS